MLPKKKYLVIIKLVRKCDLAMFQLIKQINRITRINEDSINIKELEASYFFPLKVIKKRKIKRITLRVSYIDGVVKLTMPLNFNLGEAKRFVDTQITWIEEKLKNVGSFYPVVSGMMLPIGGHKKRLAMKEGINLDFYQDRNSLVFLKSCKPIDLRVKEYLKQTARKFFIDTCTKYSKRLGVRYESVNIKDPKTRWGSCSSSGNIMFSWRLMMAPSKVSDYVAAHEVAHLVHLNHSKDFWDTVEQICPNYREHRHWLRENGRNLHRFIFSAE